MKKQTYRYLTILIGITIGISACKTPEPTPKPDVKMQIDSEYLTELNWGDIEAMLIPCAERGLCNVEINGFLFELPTTHWNAEGRDDDPLFFEDNTYRNNRKRLEQWSTKHSNDQVQVFFGEKIDFNVVKDVITTLQEHDIKVRCRNHKEANSIQVSLYGLHPHIMHNNRAIDAHD